MKPQKLLAVDPSLTASGWALFSVDSSLPLATGVIRPPGTKIELSLRYDALQQLIEELLDKLSLGEEDFLVCEGPAPLVKNPESALRVERVRSIFEAVGRASGARVIPRLNPRTVQSELLGLRGKQLKREIVKEVARAAATKLFGDDVRTLSQDSVDALLVGSLAVSKVQLHIRSGVPLESLFQAKAERNSSRFEGFRGWRSNTG